MALSREHGASRPIVLPPDEQPFAPAGAGAPLVRRGTAGRVADAEAARALARMPRRSAFIPRKFACDPRFEVHNRRRVEWTRKRRQELYETTGGVSHAVGAMIVAAGWLYAAAEFACELAAASGDVDLFKASASLSATGRTHDMGSWELATREAAARPQAPADPLRPYQYLLESDTESSNAK